MFSRRYLPVEMRVVIVFYSIVPFMYLLRGFLGDSGFVAVVLRIYQPVVIIFFGVFAIRAIFSSARAPLAFYGMLVYLVYGLLIGFLNENKPYDIFSGGFYYVSGLLVYFYFLNSRGTHYEVFFERLTVPVLISYTVAIALMYILPTLSGVNIYLGMASHILLLIYFRSFERKNVLRVGLVLALIILSGKRGVLLALIAVSMIYFYQIYCRNNIKFSIKLGLLLVSIGFVTVMALPESFNRLAAKFTVQQFVDTNRLSSGRLDEFDSAVSFWTMDRERFFIGSGFGFTYDYVSSNDVQEDVSDYKNVHFSYINPLISFGLILGLVYYLLFFTLFSKAYFSRRVPNYLKYALASYLIYACFVFNIFNEIILWAILGIMYRSNRVRESVEASIERR